jgi:hypothetical protein
MVRILKVKELENRKRVLLAQSDLYRQTLQLEVTNVKLALTLLKRRLQAVKSTTRLLGLAAPVVGLLFGLRRFRKREEPKASGGAGLFSRLLAGVRLLGHLRPLWQGLVQARRAAGESGEPQDFEEPSL